MLRDHVSANSVESINIVESGRREFLKGLLGVGALVLSVRWAPETVFAAGTDPASANPAFMMDKGPGWPRRRPDGVAATAPVELTAGGRPLRGGFFLSGQRGPDISFDVRLQDPAARTAAFDLVEVYPEFAGEAPRQRTGVRFPARRQTWRRPGCGIRGYLRGR